MAESKRDVDRMKPVGQFVNDERFAVQLIDTLDGVASIKTPGLPKEETQCHAFEFGAEMRAWSDRELFRTELRAARGGKCPNRTKSKVRRTFVSSSRRNRPSRSSAEDVAGTANTAETAKTDAMRRIAFTRVLFLGARLLHYLHRTVTNSGIETLPDFAECSQPIQPSFSRGCRN